MVINDHPQIRMQKPFVFAVVRHPYERLVSSYLDFGQTHVMMSSILMIIIVVMIFTWTLRVKCSSLQVKNLSSCLSNIGPLYHPRITPDPTYHILLLWYDILLMGLHFYFTSNIFDWPGEQWISTLRAFAVPLLRFSSSVIHRDSFLASTISSSNDHGDGGEKIEKNTFMK